MMRKVKTVSIMGIWLAILPYLGFPYYIKNILYTLTGLSFVLLGYTIYKDFKKEHSEETCDNFSENKDFHEGEIITENYVTTGNSEEF